jgi:hypothetical protein
MSHKRRGVIASAMILASVGLFTLPINSYHTRADIPYVLENDYPFVSNHGQMETVQNLGELISQSEVIAEVQIKEQENIRLSESSVATRSKAKVNKLYKGSSESELTITEIGGVLDLSTVKGHEDRVPENYTPHSTPSIVEVGIEGSTVMKPHQKYLVFLHKHPDTVWGYNIVGVVQGKIKIDNTDTLIATIEPKHLNDSNIYFLQKDFSGMNKQSLEKEIKKNLN